MSGGCVAILDVGKTNAKLSLWSSDGECVGAAVHANADVEVGAYRALDVDGLRQWLMPALRDFARRGQVEAIVPVSHGAAAAVIDGDQIVAPPMSYECNVTAADYARKRDAFAQTGSPRLPLGLNLGAQLHDLERIVPNIFEGDARILPYPQYWAWLLSGVAVSEVSSLGCHTDLWRPHEARFSDLAIHAGWAERFAPLRRAHDVLGPISAAWAEATGLSPDCRIYCGAHDSNVAFYGVRSHPALAGRDVTVISTGTWFVAMRAPADGKIGALDEARDTLINVGVDGLLIPSARFMGGREMEVLIGAEDTPMRTREFARDVAPAHVDDVIARGAMILPSFAPGVGPFPSAVAEWRGEELQGAPRRAAAGLYLALVADTSLDLIGARDAIVVEGRFADDMSFLRMLATLRPSCEVYAARSDDGLAFGARRLIDPDLQSNASLTRIAPLATDVRAYVSQWRALAGVR